MHTPTPTTAIGPDAVIHLGDDLDITMLAVNRGFWTHDASNDPHLSDGRILAVFDYTETWPYWERHPTGDELVYVLAGDVELLLDHDLHTQSIHLRAGEAAIVPTGTWHRAAIHAPSRMLFVTPTPRRTEQRPLETAH
jgi:uncharacterized cupin superfamily protein